jgi:hypothetical protein
MRSDPTTLLKSFQPSLRSIGAMARHSEGQAFEEAMKIKWRMKIDEKR